MRKQKFPFAFFLIALIVCLSCKQSWGWIGTGHKVIALIAWEDMTPKTREAITTLLKQHPRFEKDLLLDAPADQTPDEQARTAFATAATWPDLVRNQDNPMHVLYNHPSWHFIDIPYSVGGQPPVEKQVEGPAPHNAVEALTQNMQDLKDPAKSGAEKAVALCWVEHILGDIHQPLHAVSLYSAEFPQGDRGGNSEFVLRDPPYPSSINDLHFIWDSLPGDFQSEDLARYEAQGLRADPKYSRDKMKDQLPNTDFMDWAKESYKLAVDDVYLNGNLKAAAGRGRRGDGNPTPGLPPGYLEKAEHVAMHQVTLAGYRLADQLNAIFDPK